MDMSCKNVSGYIQENRVQHGLHELQYTAYFTYLLNLPAYHPGHPHAGPRGRGRHRHGNEEHVDQRQGGQGGLGDRGGGHQGGWIDT